MRFEDAQILYNGGRHAAAYYMAGYAVECALKACIAKRTREFDFPLPPNENKTAYSHGLNDLLKLLKLDVDMREVPETLNLWRFVEEWKVESRYDLSIGMLRAKQMLDAVGGAPNASNGVLVWLRSRW